jgi:hypothetical protein
MNTIRAVLALLLVSLASGLFADDRLDDSFVFKYRGETRIRSMNDSIDAERMPAGDYFWFRHEGRTYRIVDAPRTLAQLDAAYAPVRAAKDEARRIKDKRRALKTRDRELRTEQRSLERRVRTAERADQPVASHENDLRRIERERASLERQMSDLEDDIDRAQQRADAAREVADRQWLRIAQEAIRTGVAARE